MLIARKGAVQMQFHKKFLLCLVVVFLVFILPVQLVAADEPESIVDAVFTFTVESGTTITIDVDMDVSKLTTYKSFTAAEIATASSEDLGALRYELFLLLQEQLQQMFEYVTLVNFTMPVYSSGSFSEQLQATLQPAFFQLDSSVNAPLFIDGMLDIGAVVSYSFLFAPTPGWINSYQLNLPQTFIFRNTTGTLDGDMITWDVNNRLDEGGSERGWLSLQYLSPTTTQPTQKNISLDFSVDTRAVTTTILTTTVNAMLVNSSVYGILPDSIQDVSFLPADAVRLVISQGLLSWNEVYNFTIAPIRDHVISHLAASSLNQSIDTVFSWIPETTLNCTTPYDVENMNDDPPLQAQFVDDDVFIKIFDETIKAIYGLVNAGATARLSSDDITIGDAFDQIIYPYTSTLFLPDNVLLENQSVYQWNISGGLAGALRTNQPPSYNQEEVLTRINIDVERLDLNLMSIFSGKTEMTASTKAAQTINLHVATVPSLFRLPQQVQLDYMNADAFRVCIDEGVFTAEEVAAYLEQQTAAFKTHIATVLDVEETTGYTNEDVFTESLLWDGDIGNMDGLSPISIASNAHSLYAVPYALSLVPPEVNISQQQFLLTGKEGQTTTYRLTFPKGISIEGNDELGKTLTFDIDEEGKEYLEITFNEDDEDLVDMVTLTLTASPLYMLGLFMPCILSFILVIILIVLVWFLRKKTKGRSLFKKKGKEEASYEGEDFYVPPTPPSAR